MLCYILLVILIFTLLASEEAAWTSDADATKDKHGLRWRKGRCSSPH